MNAARAHGLVPASTRLRTRGLLAVTAAIAIQSLIEYGWAQPWPDRTTAMLIGAAVASWGVIDLLRHAATVRPRPPVR